MDRTTIENAINAATKAALDVLFAPAPAPDPGPPAPSPAPIPAPDPVPAPDPIPPLPTPAPPPPAPIPPLPGAPPYTLKLQRGTLLRPTDGMDRFLALSPAAQGVIAGCADGLDKPTGDKLLCCLFFAKYGTAPVCKRTQADYLADAIRLAAVAPTNAFPLSTGSADLLDFTMAPIGLAYDWLYNELDPGIRDAIKAKIVQDLTDAMTNTQAVGSHWQPYNYPSSMGLLGALSVAEKQDDPLVTAYWANMWDTSKSQYNYSFYDQYFHDGGCNEGWGYQLRWGPAYVCSAAWLSATGSLALDAIGVLNSYADWTYYGSDWGQFGPKVKATRPCMTLYDGGAAFHQGTAKNLAALTSDPDHGPTAAWLLANQSFDGATPGDLLLYRVLIGDPRTTPKRPAALDYTITGQGHAYRRRSADPLNTFVYFGCGRVQTRATPANEVSVYSRGKPLLLCRARLWDHQYCCDYGRNTLCWYGDGTTWPETERPFKINFSAGPTLPAFGGYSELPDGTMVGDIGPQLYTPRAPATAIKAGKIDGYFSGWRRTVKFDKPANTITVTDAIDAPGALQPHLCWGMIQEPQVNGRVVTITNGDASCVMTFDRDVQIIKWGGPVDAGTDLLHQRSSGTENAGKLDGFYAASPAIQESMGGWWRIEVVPARGSDGKFDCGVVIQVN